MSLILHNSLSGKKEPFTPLKKGQVGMYVCGPTVYDRAHIGNARAVVVYDVLYRLLKQHYANVTYVRNITDVDDKINAAAKANQEPISELTRRVTGWFHDDMAALGNLLPDKEPKATEHIAQIITLIQQIIANGHAYESEGHVLFDVQSVKADEQYHYGLLSGKKTEDLIAGARVDVESYKRHAEDFVLWKPADAEDDPSSVFDSPWGAGRPGWHIECSAMSTTYLGTDFDIHGGGADLKFPHHENEIAQSCCGNKGSHYARFWVHNGFVTVNGEKMSKSLGNFTTVHDLLEKGVKGEAIRYVLLATHYRKPLDFSQKSIEDATKNLDTLYGALQIAQENTDRGAEPDADVSQSILQRSQAAKQAFIEALQDDMNTPKALAELYTMAKGIRSVNAAAELVQDYRDCASLLGLLSADYQDWFTEDTSDIDVAWVEEQIAVRTQAKQEKNWAEADKIRDILTSKGIILKDTAEGTSWRKA